MKTRHINGATYFAKTVNGIYCIRIKGGLWMNAGYWPVNIQKAFA